MNRVVLVDLEDKEATIGEEEKQKRRKTSERYDSEDSFYEEDEKPEKGETDCRYENFYCVQGDSLAPAERRSEGRDEKSEKKKEKREIIREKFVDEKEKLVRELESVPESRIEEVIERLVVLEVVTEQEPSAEMLVRSIRETTEQAYNTTEDIVRRTFAKERLEKIVESVKKEIEAIEEEIKRCIGENESASSMGQEGGTGGDAEGSSKIKFNDSFMEILSNYTDREYIVFYMNLYLSGKKRVLEHSVKKNIFINLRKLFPPDIREKVMSLGKKIAVHFLKKTKQPKKGKTEREQEAEAGEERAEGSSVKESSREEGEGRGESQTGAQEIFEEGAVSDACTPRETQEDFSFDIKFTQEEAGKEAREKKQAPVINSAETDSLNYSSSF